MTNHKTIWKLSSLPDVEEFLFAVKDPERNALASEVMKEFNRKILPNMEQLKSGLITLNIIMSKY